MNEQKTGKRPHSTEESERKRKHKKRKTKKEKKKHKKKKQLKQEKEEVSGDEMIGPVPSTVLTECEKKSMVPMTKEQWEKKQSIVRRVFDPDTGRNRLIKGDGEIIEEIVSYSRHKEINRQATKGDGSTFQKKLGLTKQ